MPSRNWSNLSSQQIGRYAEYYAKMEFTSYGWEVYTSEVDDHGVDFVAKSIKTNQFYEVQVKAARKPQQIFIPKTKMPKQSLPNRLVCFLWFKDGALPDFYVIPGTAWLTPNAGIASYDYGKPGQKSEAEWSINVREKNREFFEPYRSDLILQANL